MSKKQRILNGILMAFCMSFAMTLINLGMSDIFFKAWMKSWVIGLIVTLPISFIFPPIIGKLVMKIKI
ncbi:protein of unknown function DUF2798 [Gottschalkia purinilytica]|uniref:DUF2798 domain-containing protein n=1 Tax=Gottschalkia purinilytica TaxID=1503 RepID=A0A0L0W875_GOTPU|nr:DUF2798 domain-containing protein [Gottschalkia purinilytica]KNF07652.1 protein of unknown function DUF2798 [Gottschalkia purinilytica]